VESQVLPPLSRPQNATPVPIYFRRKLAKAEMDGMHHHSSVLSFTFSFAFALSRFTICPYRLLMHSMRYLLFLLIATSCILEVQAARPKLIKILPQYLDERGRHALSPSLYDRDAYQSHLRRHPELRLGLQFAVQWKGPNASPLKLRVEMRGALGPVATATLLEGVVKYHGLFSNWAILKIVGDDYKNFGELIAWRATLWEGDKQLAEQKSFLW
jgi:hypothetical protein